MVADEGFRRGVHAAVTLEAKCVDKDRFGFRRKVRFNVRDELIRTRSLVLYDLDPEQAERFTVGRKYNVTIEEEKPE